MQLFLYLCRADLTALAKDFTDFHELEMAAKHGRQSCFITVHIQHAAVIMAEKTDTSFSQTGRGLACRQPAVNLLPGSRILQSTGDQMVVDMAAIKNRGDLGRRTGLTISQPFAGHDAAITQCVESRIVNAGCWLQAEHNDRRFDLLHHRQHRGAEGIGGNIQQNHIHLFSSQTAADLPGLLRIIDKACVDEPDSRMVSADPLSNGLLIALQTFVQTGKLRPIGVQADPIQADRKGP
ncbi:MAG: hypothetical protein BWY83_02837 [bacterium ADurb.Bin478]|nr:MAG: hypothetical protein BWY83_02837 [bacterium ADurb.Bin478]